MKSLAINHFFVGILYLWAMGSTNSFAATTPTGIALDQDWKVKLNEFASKVLLHPSWGYSHSERDYQNTKKLAAKEHIVLDLDVLFAASFLHDIGGLPPYEKEGVDHGVRSAEVGTPLLIAWGFPKEKTQAVQEIIVGHIYYGPIPTQPVARLFRDADILDFLGTIGVSRILAVNQELGKTPTIANSIQVLEKFLQKLPGELSSRSAKRDSIERIRETRAFLKSLETYSFSSKAY